MSVDVLEVAGSRVAQRVEDVDGAGAAPDVTASHPVAVRAGEQGPLLLDELALGWWAALDAARSALRAAGSTLPAGEVAERSRRLGDERVGTIQLLGSLAHELHADSRLLELLAAPRITPSMLGLPDGVEACVFDLDGVLTTSAVLHAEAWAETLDAFLVDRAAHSAHPVLPFDPHRDYEDYIAGRPRLEGVRAFLGSRGISLPEGRPDDAPDAHTVHGLANRKNQVLQRRLDREGVAAFDGSRCYLEAVRMLGVHRAVVSASANTQTFLERAGLSGLIEETVDGETMRIERLRAEPEPDTLLAACARLGVSPARSVVFETTPAGIAAARNAHVRLAVGVDRDGSSRALRASDADRVVRDLTELLDRRAA